MNNKTERIELKTGCIKCTPNEAYTIFHHFARDLGEDVVWFTTQPCLSFVLAQVKGKIIH